VARPKKPEGAMENVVTRLPGPTVRELERIAEDQGVTVYVLAARVLSRYVEDYPADES
jgi:hypothetical protein